MELLKLQNLEENPEKLNSDTQGKGPHQLLLASGGYETGSTAVGKLQSRFSGCRGEEPLLREEAVLLDRTTSRQEAQGKRREHKQEEAGPFCFCQPGSLPLHPLLAQPNREPLAKQKCRTGYQRLSLQLKVNI